MDAPGASAGHAAPDDPRLTDFIGQAERGEVTLFRAQVPIRYLRPFSATYKPVDWAPWVALVDIVKQRLQHENAAPIVTYQEGDFFVVSGDYATYYACLESGVANAPCLVFGEPVGGYVGDVHPATTSEVLQALGIAQPRKAPPPAPIEARPEPPLNIF